MDREMNLRTVRAEEHEKQVRESQSRYIASQVKLLELILGKVEESDHFYPYKQEGQLQVALAIYKGYCLTDVEDAIRGLE